jgi:hypothetical protein
LAALLIGTPAFVILIDQVFGIFGSALNGRLKSRTEFGSAPVQLVAQFRRDRVELPPGIELDEVLSLSSQPDPESKQFLIDLTLSFTNKRDAIACLDSLQNEQLVFSSVRSVES